MIAQLIEITTSRKRPQVGGGIGTLHDNADGLENNVNDSRAKINIVYKRTIRVIIRTRLHFEYLLTNDEKKEANNYQQFQTRKCSFLWTQFILLWTPSFYIG